MNTGFIIVAYLILWSDSIEYPIPFATMDACINAEATYKEFMRPDYVKCIPTGAKSGIVNFKIEWNK